MQEQWHVNGQFHWLQFKHFITTSEVYIVAANAT